MSWFSPRTVRGWFVLIVLGALALSQLASFALMAGQQTILRSALHEAEVFRRTAGIIALARGAKPETLKSIEDTASGPSFLVSFSGKAAVPGKARNGALSEAFARSTGTQPGSVRVAWDATVGSFQFRRIERVTNGERTVIITRGPGGLAPEAEHDVTVTIPHVRLQPHIVSPVPPVPPPPPGTTMEWVVGPDLDGAGKPPSRLDISVEIEPKRWLNVSAVPPPAPSIMWPMIWTGALAAVLVALAAVWAAGRVARPIAGLTTAAERMGRGDGLVLAPEEGPQDVKAAAAAFNTMASRLRRMIDDQRALLSAVGHDLRTPIASLRIRTELVKDPELQAKMRGSLEEMERLTEATLAAARGGESGEPTRPVDLPSLIEAVCDDLADTGSTVSFATLPAARVEGRASELRRALRNLIENAVRYGSQAAVSMTIDGGFANISVDDEGPGIPGDKLAHVMKPFVRLEESRSVETGGHGLGLTIARAIAERHAGELVLSNRAEGGLRATLRLPLAN
ncbi:MAG: HAMP domain-containing protein [Alphaproteobacteria bacterium]|nr:HAMP domain-containing protein [Alphaproteobacteria bacterium]